MEITSSYQVEILSNTDMKKTQYRFTAGHLPSLLMYVIKNGLTFRQLNLKYKRKALLRN